ncbi:MAG: hypothetical protein ACPL7J_11100, partial [Desulfomonilaceae bacterium]
SYICCITARSLMRDLICGPAMTSFLAISATSLAVIMIRAAVRVKMWSSNVAEMIEAPST